MHALQGQWKKFALFFSINAHGRVLKFCKDCFMESIPEFLDSGRKSWMLESGRWTLDAALWMLDSGRSSDYTDNHIRTPGSRT